MIQVPLGYGLTSARLPLVPISIIASKECVRSSFRIANFVSLLLNQLAHFLNLASKRVSLLPTWLPLSETQLHLSKTWILAIEPTLIQYHLLQTKTLLVSSHWYIALSTLGISPHNFAFRITQKAFCEQRQLSSILQLYVQ